MMLLYPCSWTLEFREHNFSTFHSELDFSFASQVNAVIIWLEVTTEIFSVFICVLALDTIGNRVDPFKIFILLQCWKYFRL